MKFITTTTGSRFLALGLAALGLALLVPAVLNAQSSTSQAPGRARATPQPVTSSDYAYSYDALGRLTEVVYPDGTTLTYAYDTRSNITDITVVP